MAQFQFKRTGDADYPRYLKILLQGPPKSGKTTFISTAPNVVVAAVEAGLMSIAHLDVPYVEIDGTDKLQTLQMVLSDESLRTKAASQLGLPQIDTVAIDTLDAYQEMLKREIMKENRRTQMQQADWGTLKERMAAILKSFISLPLNVILTVHTATTQDDESRMIYTPALQGSIKDDVAGYVDFSLLAFRDRQIDANGVPTIAYFLKNEGDLKNPSLGNRAAGRVPEISRPVFRDLHDAVFKGIDRQAPSLNPTSVEFNAPQHTPVAQPQPTQGETVVNLPEPEATSGETGGQKWSGTPSTGQADQPPAAPAAPPVAPQPSGTPLADDDKPINATGVQVLTKHYMTHSLVLPGDIQTWTLGKARLISKWFVAVKKDVADGQEVTRDAIVDYLKAYDAYAGDLPGVQTGVENVPTPPKPAPEPAEGVKSPEPPVDASPTPSPATPEAATADAEEAAALALIQEKLGGVEIGRVVNPDDKCVVCNNEIDDVEVARLGLTRFEKILCVADYRAQSKIKASV